MLFYKYGGANVAVINCISQFSMFVSTKATVKLDNGNTRHAQGIGIILCRFSNYSIIYPVVPVYYFTGHLSNTISSGALKFYAGFQKFTSELFEHCDFVDSQGSSWSLIYQIQNNLDYIKIEIVKVNPNRDRNIFFPTFCGLSKQNLSQILHQNFGHVSITRLKKMARKGLI